MLQSLATVVSLVGILIYFLGWTYLYSYFNFFNIDVYEIDPSLQYVLVYAFPALGYAVYHVLWQPVAMISALLIAGFILWVLLDAPRRWARLSWAIASAASLIWIVSVTYGNAWQAGVERAKWKWSSSDPTVVHGESGNLANLVGGFDHFFSNGTVVDDRCAASQNPMRSPISCFNDKLALREIFSTARYHYLFAVTPSCNFNEYKVCPGLVFKANVDGSGYLTTLHPGEK